MSLSKKQKLDSDHPPPMIETDASLSFMAAIEHVYHGNEGFPPFSFNYAMESYIDNVVNQRGNHSSNCACMIEVLRQLFVYNDVASVVVEYMDMHTRVWLVRGLLDDGLHFEDLRPYLAPSLRHFLGRGFAFVACENVVHHIHTKQKLDLPRFLRWLSDNFLGVKLSKAERRMWNKVFFLTFIYTFFICIIIRTFFLDWSGLSDRHHHGPASTRWQVCTLELHEQVAVATSLEHAGSNLLWCESHFIPRWGVVRRIVHPDHRRRDERCWD